MNQSCNDYRPLVPAYLDGELSEAQAGPLRRHLLACSPCRVAAQGQRSLRSWFVPTDPIAVPAGFAARIARRAFAGDTGEPPAAFAPARGRGAEPTPLRAFLLRATAVAAGLLLALSAGIRSLDVPTTGDVSADADVPMRLERILGELDALKARAEPAPSDSRAAPAAVGEAGRRPARAAGDPGAVPAQPAGREAERR